MRALKRLYLKTLELLLLGPVVEGGDEDDDQHGDQDGQALDPFRMVHSGLCTVVAQIRDL